MFLSVAKLFICASAFFQTCVADKCNIGFLSELSTSTECFTTFAECGFDNLQTRHPSLYNKTGWRRDPPSNVKLTPFCEPNSAGVNDSGINMQWNLPNSQSAAGIAGYELRVEGDNPNFRCLVVILGEKATPTNIHMVLNSTMYPVRRNKDYMIVLHSLPRANNSEPVSKQVRSMNCKRGSTSSNWVPTGHNYSYKWPEKTLVVWFQPPPPAFNISKFKLTLFHADNREKLSNTTQVKFTDVEPGKYTLYMQPYNEHPHDKDLCVCRDDENRCKSCSLSKWNIDVKVPKKLPSTSPSGQGHEVTVGVPCATVVLTILVFLLYKFLVKRSGKKCMIGKSSKSDKDDILYVMCIDVNATPREESKLRVMLENELNTTVKFKRITAMPDITSKMSLLWNKWNIGTSSTDSGKIVVANKPGVSINILICLLISKIEHETLSELLSKVHSNIPKTGPLRVQICAVTFADNFVLSQCTSLKCFALKTDQQQFVIAVRNAFPKLANEQDPSVVYICGSTNSCSIPENDIRNNTKSGVYVALPKSHTENNEGIIAPKKKLTKNNDHLRGHKNKVVITGNPVPEIMHLGVAEQRRERYISSDSGRGGSVLSYKTGHLPDDLGGLWHETRITPSETELQQVNSEGLNGTSDNYQTTKADRSSCDISFFPPDQSDISELDFDLNSIDCDDAHRENDNEYSVGKLQGKKCSNRMNGLTITAANSMDSLMEKMAQINERSALILQQDIKPDEVHSVWEGHV